MTTGALRTAIVGDEMNLNAFLNSKSMFTPGVAGALCLLLATSLAGQFGLPANWTTLAFSFLLGLVVFGDKRVQVLQRVVLYVVNSMIIFTVAVGANTTGGALSGQTARDEDARAAEARQAALAAVQTQFDRYAADTGARLQSLENMVTASSSTPPQVKANVTSSIAEVNTQREHQRVALQRAATEAVVPGARAQIRAFQRIFH